MFFISMEAIGSSSPRVGRSDGVGSAQVGWGEGQPLTAPLVRPATMRRWKMSTSTTTGIVTITAAAAMEPVGSTNCEAPEKRPSAAGTGRASLVDVSEMPYAKSFHAMKKAMIAVVKTPGAASGTITLRNACQVVAPSTCAACSISQGISRKNADIVQIEIGRVSDRYGMISPSQVSYRPMFRQRLNSGVTIEMIGK